MNRILRLALAAMFSAATALPALASPVGLWEIEMGDSRYDVTLCGDGTQLCAELVWLGNGADTPENVPYLNTMLIDHAKQIGPAKWSGELHLYGQTASGTIEQQSDGVITLTGCMVLVICKSYTMYRIGR